MGDEPHTGDAGRAVEGSAVVHNLMVSALLPYPYPLGNPIPPRAGPHAGNLVSVLSKTLAEFTAINDQRTRRWLGRLTPPIGVKDYFHRIDRYSNASEDNKYYASVGGITLPEMNYLEHEFLKLVDFDLFVSLDDYWRPQEISTRGAACHSGKSADYLAHAA
eukprot:gene32224-27361_t